MEPAASDQYHQYIESVRDDIAECARQLQSKRQEIAAALKQSEELTIDAATLKVRMKELELDEELVKQSEDAAIQERVLAEKRLMEIGGYDRAVRVLQRALLEAKRELQNTKDEKAHIMSEEKKLHQELVQLNMILHKTRASSVKLQQEYGSAVKSKRETDEKLERLSLFLQKTIESSSAQSSPRSSPTKPQLATTTAAAAQTAAAAAATTATQKDPSLFQLPLSAPSSDASPSKRASKEASLSPPSPLPSPSSIRSQLAKWTSSAAALGKTGSARTGSITPSSTRTESTASLPSTSESSPTASSG